MLQINLRNRFGFLLAALCAFGSLEAVAETKPPVYDKKLGGYVFFDSEGKMIEPGHYQQPLQRRRRGIGISPVNILNRSKVVESSYYGINVGSPGTELEFAL